MTTRPDVIIVGAGMPGATLALALAAGGLEPVLIDPLPFELQCAPTFDGRASAISFAAFRQWRALGAAPRRRGVAIGGAAGERASKQDRSQGRSGGDACHARI